MAGLFCACGAGLEEQALGSGDLNSYPPLTQQARWFGQEQPLWASVSHSPKCITLCILSQELLSSEILGSHHLLYNCQVLFISVSISSFNKTTTHNIKVRCMFLTYFTVTQEDMFNGENTILLSLILCMIFIKKDIFFQNSFFFLISLGSNPFTCASGLEE